MRLSGGSGSGDRWQYHSTHHVRGSAEDDTHTRKREVSVDVDVDVDVLHGLRNVIKRFRTNPYG